MLKNDELFKKEELDDVGVGVLLRIGRLNMKKTVKDRAEELGFSQAYLSKVETSSTYVSEKKIESMTKGFDPSYIEFINNKIKEEAEIKRKRNLVVSRIDFLLKSMNISKKKDFLVKVNESLN